MDPVHVTKVAQGGDCGWSEGHIQLHFLDVDLKPLLLDEDRDFKLVTANQKEPCDGSQAFKRQMPINVGSNSKRPRSDR
eukprot:Skav219226  [mRNA]  locus=scaffold2965:15229:22371:+ [translate_table: standard]